MAEEVTRQMENTTINKSETDNVVDPWSVKASSIKESIMKSSLVN